MSDSERPFYPVLHIDTGRTWGGGQQQVLHLHRGLLRKGIPSILVCPSGSALARRAIAESLPVTEVRLRRPLRLFAAMRVVRVAREHGVRTIHMHTSPAHSIGLIASRMLKGNVRMVVSRRVAFPHRNNFLTRRKYVGRGIHYIAISQAVKQTLLDLGVPEPDITVVHSGIEVERFACPDREKAHRLAAELRIPEGSFVIGSVGSLVPCKGHSVLVEAFQQIVAQASPPAPPNPVCLIVGDGPEKPRIEISVRKKGLRDRVVFAGQREEIPELLSLMDVFVMPSLQEGLGTAALEAMAAAKPVIASNVGGLSEAVVDGRTGFLVVPGESAALARVILQLVNDPGKMSALASNASKHVRDRFSCEAMVKGTIAVYRSL
ncbi:MAG: glycosyltransferase [bacterium]|nr:glycosyltransferase [bacterium]